MVKKVITNLDSSKASGPGCIPVLVLKNCKPELSYILVELFPLPNNLYKNYTKCIQKLCKTLNMYMFCIQKLYKSKFCMIMNVQKMYIKFLQIYKKCTNCKRLVQSSD